jgi:hypothetical protein
MSAKIEIYGNGGDRSLIITGVEQLLIFSCRPLCVNDGDVVRFEYDFMVEAITDGVHTSTYTDPIVITKAVDKLMQIRSIVVHVTKEGSTLELSEEERPDAPFQV